MITVETYSSNYLKLLTPEKNYYFSSSFGWICAGMPFEVKSMVNNNKEVERLEILIHAHCDEIQLKQLKLYLSAKKLQLKTS